jgi:hypothetical protein
MTPLSAASRHCIMLLLVCAWAWPAAGETPSAPTLKAGFILSFTRFAAWPDDAPASRAPLRLCVLGDDKIAASLHEATRGKPVGERDVIVTQPEPEVAGTSCDVVYSSGLERKELAVLLAAVRGVPILTVSDSQGFARIGGMIELYEQAGRIRFAIHLHNVQRSRLKMSSSVLSLATLVDDGQ